MPAECGCKADQYNEEEDCKHRVALASIGGSVVLDAAANYETPSVDPTTSESLMGGIHPINDSKFECSCDDLPDDFPCWPYVKDGKRVLSE